MSAANAFATARGRQEDEAGQNKRRRLFDAPATRIPPLPRVQPDVSLDVDIMILDFLAFDAIKACLETRISTTYGSSRGSLGAKLQLVNSFTTVFKARHQQARPDRELRVRLLLLKMVVLLTQRYTMNPTTPDKSTLQDLRSSNRQRAQAWVESRGLAPSSTCDVSLLVKQDSIALERLEGNRAHVLHQLDYPAEDEDYADAFYGTSGCISLLDILPLFVELSAASDNLHGGGLTPRWMQLACEFMLQASLEQYLVFGTRGAETLDEAFAWGYDENSLVRNTSSGEHSAQINDMFEDDDYAMEVEGWDALKNEYIQELMGHGPSDAKSSGGPDELDFASHMEGVAAMHPIDSFEASVAKFLRALSASVAEPVLAQLKRGHLDGMTKEETKAFLMQCGVDLSHM